ncbi:MAG: hypothetical protein ACYDH6_23470 [Acidimicrobiales bacterium]
MVDRRSDAPEDLIRTRRLEVVDSGGRLRAVLGDRAEGPLGQSVFGLGLVGVDGTEWVSLTTDAAGTCLSFARAGNEVTVMRVEISDEDGSGSYLLLLDPNGDPTFGWRIGMDGNVEPYPQSS